MKTTSFKKTAVAAAVAGTLAAAGIPAAEANVVNLSWKGAFTFLTPLDPSNEFYGSAITNSPSDYANGFYGVTGTASGPATTFGWKGIRTPISGTMSFDTNTGSGVATITPFLFLGNSTLNYMGVTNLTFQSIDTVGTLVGGMMFSWSGGSSQVSIVMDAGQMFTALPTLLGGGPTTTVSSTYSAVSNEVVPASAQITTAIARTSTLNTGAGCDGLTLATQVNTYTINTNFANVGICTTGMNDDGIGGDPMTSAAFTNYNANFDVLSVTFQNMEMTPPQVPVPAAVWLFGSGLLGLIGLARRKKAN
jgi:hypothetical protein